MKYTVRRFTEEEEEDIADFHRRIFPTEDFYESAGWGGFYPTDGWGLYTDKLIGYAMYNENYLFFFGIDEKYRGRGLARFLLECVILECDEIRLHVKINNKPAVALYSKLGFVPIEYKKSYYGINDDGMLMERVRPKFLKK